MAKREAITLQTKQNLMDAFWDLYCGKGLDQITVKDICVRAGYNRSTFYVYFRDARDVLEEWERGLIPTLERMPPAQTPTGSIGMPLEQFFSLYERHAPYYAVLLGERGDPAFAGKLKDAVKPILTEELSRTTALDDRKMAYVLEFALLSMIGMMSFWFSQKDPMPKEELYALLKQLMEGGAFSLLA